MLKTIKARGKRSAAAPAMALAAAVLGMALPQVVHASSVAGSTYKVRAHVPVACWVRPEAPVSAEAGKTGRVIEACNSPGGFTVTAQYRTLDSNENAHIRYGDRTLQLNKAGDQLLRHSSMATIRTIEYRFEEVELNSPLVLALTIQPI